MNGNGIDLRQEFEDVLGNIIAFLPNLIAALLILLIGYFIAMGLDRLTRRGLRGLRFDRAINSSPAGTVVSRVVDSPSRFTGRVVFWLVFIGAISLAVAALNLPLLNNLLNGLYGYVPHIIAAVAIFLVASAISAGSARFVQRVMGRSGLAKIVTTGIPVIVMSLAIFMILNELEVATDIVNILFTAIVGSAALGLALAFGLGGRDAAKGLLDQAADAARSRQDSVKEQVTTAADNARRSVRR
ncbi:MAG: CmpX protein [Candidatus Saccharibacteria bacterium]|nr:CmpX protein [Candidatus Saccharibacteria bacterium]